MCSLGYISGNNLSSPAAYSERNPGPSFSRQSRSTSFKMLPICSSRIAAQEEAAYHKKERVRWDWAAPTSGMFSNRGCFWVPSTAEWACKVPLPAPKATIWTHHRPELQTGWLYLKAIGKWVIVVFCFVPSLHCIQRSKRCCWWKRRCSTSLALWWNRQTQTHTGLKLYCSLITTS